MKMASVSHVHACKNPRLPTNGRLEGGILYVRSFL